MKHTVNAITRCAVIGFALLAATQGAQAADPGRGKTLWSSCSSCHGATPATNVSGSWKASGTAANQGDASSILKGINNEPTMSMFKGVLSTTDQSDLAAYINAARYNKSQATDDQCVFTWAEVQLPSVFAKPAAQQGSAGTISYRLYATGNAVGYNSADGQVWVLAPSLGFATPVALGAATSTGLMSSARTANCSQ